MCVYVRERERHRHTHTQKETERHRKTDREREKREGTSVYIGGECGESVLVFHREPQSLEPVPREVRPMHVPP